jgi:hypothetical protein
MKSQIDSLKDRISSKKDQQSPLTSILELVRDLGCFGDILGREFEVKDTSGKLVYTIRQKPMAIKQLNVLLKEHYTLRKLDNQREAAKWGAKK